MSRKKTGCCNVHVALINKDKTFGKPQAVLDAESINYTRVYAEASNYADNKQNIYKKKLTSIDIDMDFSEIIAKTRALVQGKKYASGSILSGTNDISNDVAVLFEETYDDGTSERVVFYSAKLYEKDGSNTTEGESIEFTSQGFSGRALPFKNDKIDAIEYRIDSGDPTYDVNKFNKFFEEVQFFEEAIEVEYSSYTSGDVTDISVNGAEFDTVSKKFTNIYASCTSFTFKEDGTTKTATKSSSSWTIS